MWSRLGGDPWMRLGLVGALFALTVLFIHVPASVWAGNIAEFDSSPWALLGLGVLAALAGVAGICVLLAVLDGRTRIGLACGVCAAGLIAWGYAYFLAGGMTVLSGHGAPMNFETAVGAWELPLVAAAGLLAGLVIGRAPAAATTAFAVLNVGLAIATVATVVSADGARAEPDTAPDSARVFRFSPTQNVLVVLLDGLQADVAGDILARDARLQAAFEGFQFYRDAVSPAPTTFLSLPAIHSGEVYDTTARLPDYFTAGIEDRSFMNRFADAGYDTTLVEPAEGVCPARIATCVSTGRLLRSRGTRLRRNGLRLLDIALFRVAPVTLKRRIYDGGHWLVSGVRDFPEEIDRIFQGHDLMRELDRRFELNDGTPTLKLLHSLSTHTPYVLHDDCRTVGESSLDRLPSQARCTLLAAAELLDRLKRETVYDNTVVLLLGDHGTNPGVHPGGHTGRVGGSGAAWVHLAGAANPVFLLKPRGSRGPLRDASNPVHLADVGATLCALTGACETPVGVPAWKAMPNRPRRFHDYEWKHSYWKTRTIPRMITYDIVGPLWNPASWRRPGAVPTYRLGDEIDFGSEGTGDAYLQYGWHAPDPWGRWTSDAVAHITLRLDRPAGGPLELRAAVTAFVPPAVGSQAVSWVVNGRVLDRWSFTEDGEAVERRLLIPQALLEDARDIILQLRISAPMSPRDAGTGTDVRRLGVALKRMKLIESGGGGS